MTRRLYVIDVETTGLNCSTHHILELSCIDVESGSEFYMVPYVNSSALSRADHEALAINRYFERRVSQNMMSLEETKEGYDHLRELLTGQTFGGSNPRFDSEFVARRTMEVWHHRLADLAAYAGAALRLAPHELLGLDGICTALAVKNYEPHSAQGDAHATAECFRVLTDRYGAAPGTTVTK